jgi:two-component system, cell cycle sensor histidine kinase and response regulator CckA
MASILIVDDRESNRKLLTTLLGYQNHSTVEASDGAEGLERARALKPDLIITDILMPTMDGYEFIRRLREDAAIATTPVIFYSAHYLMQEARALATKCAVEYVISKPAEREELLRTVDAALGQALPSRLRALRNEFDDFDQQHIRVLTDKLSQKVDEVENLNARLAALIEIGRELNVTHDISQLLKRYCRAAREVIGAVCAAVCITNEAGGNPRHYYSSGMQGASFESGKPIWGVNSEIAEIMTKGVCRGGQSWAGDPAALGYPLAGPAVESYLVIPVVTQYKTYGWIGLANKIGYSEFRPNDEVLLATLAAQLAVSYENCELFDELKRRATDLEREVAEHRQSAEKYRMVVEQASDGIAIADEHGDCVEVNSKMLGMLGYTREEFLDLNLTDLIPKTDQLEDPVSLRQLLSGKLVRKECELIRSGGSFIEVEISMSRLEDGRVQAIVRDVADRKRLEAELHQSQKLEAVGRLAGGVAHDFNNLLTVILGHSDLALSRTDLSEKNRGDFENIRGAGARAALLTKQLLAFSRKQMLQPRVLDVSAAVANLTKMLGRIISANIEVVTRYDVELCTAKVDPGQLDQVILNLALNARDAMPQGGRLSFETANRSVDGKHNGHIAEVPPGEYVILTVTDTGLGMSGETRSHLFEPFFTTKTPGKGTGLGLSTVYGIVRQSGGDIRVHSEPGKGTTMRIYLPRVVERSEPILSPEDGDGLSVGYETILLVEDEDTVRSLMATILGERGYSVIEACDGQHAIEIANRHSGEIHLLLSDIMMPRMSGPDLAREILRSRPSTKVLFCSGYNGDGVLHGVLGPSTPLLRKPFTACSLALKVRDALDAGAANRASIRPELATNGLSFAADARAR